MKGTKPRLTQNSIVFILLIISKLSFAQLEVSNISNANQLMNSLLGDGENIIISNTTIKGSKKTFGLLPQPQSIMFFFKEGIIMSTGVAKDAEGPNNDTKKSSKINFLSDNDINIIADRKGCYDTALFEFDLISATDEIEFKYCFASEEYSEYVFKNVNDVFIFLVTNTDTKASKNIALLNGDVNTPITVDHINLKINSEYYIENFTYDVSTIETLQKDEKKFELAKTFQYDGFTTILTARTKVIPNVKYHFKLGISDVGDQLYDSAMFLETNSLKSIGKKPKQEVLLSTLEAKIPSDVLIHFETDSYEIIRKHHFLLLDKIVKSLKNNPKLTIKIIGHTDSVGSINYYHKLSLRRASTISNYLYSNGVSKNRFTIEGYGESKLKNNVAKDNRRVEIIFFK
ncbi:MAG: OmpA family protein [Lacinutrix sp.]|uniref:OmpA family protein n=1 Tax=Lacinutrix sp. TaxID=1937692 RepID=UPI003098F73C